MQMAMLVRCSGVVRVRCMMGTIFCVAVGDDRCAIGNTQPGIISRADLRTGPQIRYTEVRTQRARPMRVLSHAVRFIDN